MELGAMATFGVGLAVRLAICTGVGEGEAIGRGLGATGDPLTIGFAVSGIGFGAGTTGVGRGIALATRSGGSVGSGVGVAALTSSGLAGVGDAPGSVAVSAKLDGAVFLRNCA